MNKNNIEQNNTTNGSAPAPASRVHTGLPDHKNNRIELVTGRLIKDPYVALLKNGEHLCEMSVMVQSEQNRPLWRKVVVFGKLAEKCKGIFRKDSEIFARGPVAMKSYVNKDGQEKEYFEIRASMVGTVLA